MFNLEDYMNKPESPVYVGMKCIRTDYLVCDIVYEVKEVLEKNEKFYARCEYHDEFDGSLKEEVIWVHCLEEVIEQRVEVRYA